MNLQMHTRLIILLTALLLGGCGVFNHQQRTYYVKETLPAQLTQIKPFLQVQIVPTTDKFVIPFLYHSRKWGGPYSILFSGDSRSDICTHFLLHSFKLKSENKVIEEKYFATPQKLDLCGSRLGFRNKHKMYSHQLDDSFLFVKDRIIELEVEFERPDVPGVRSILLRGKGEEQIQNYSLWDAYMSV